MLQGRFGEAQITPFAAGHVLEMLYRVGDEDTFADKPSIVLIRWRNVNAHDYFVLSASL